MNTTRSATIEVRSNGSIIKLGVSGSTVDVYIPASMGTPTSMILEGAEVPITAEVVTINGTEYYLIKAPRGEIVVKLSPGTETITTTIQQGGTTTTTTTAQTTTTTSHENTGTQTTFATPQVGGAPIIYVVVVALVGAVTLAVFIIRKRR